MENWPNLLQVLKPLTLQYSGYHDLGILPVWVIIKLILKKYKNVFLKEKFKSERSYVKRWPYLFLMVNTVEIKTKILHL